jgi:hypothetical protein
MNKQTIKIFLMILFLAVIIVPVIFVAMLIR